MCFWYDTPLTIQYLESKGATEFVFKEWIQLLPEYTTDFECQRIMFGLASLLRIDITNFPQVIYNGCKNEVLVGAELSARVTKGDGKVDF